MKDGGKQISPDLNILSVSGWLVALIGLMDFNDSANISIKGYHHAKLHGMIRGIMFGSTKGGEIVVTEKMLKLKRIRVIF